MGLKNAIERLKYDARMVDWNISNKVISQEDYNKYLEQLPDQSANCESVKIDADSDSASSRREEYPDQDQYS